MAKKTRAQTKAISNPSADKILAMWLKSNKSGLGRGKRLDQSIATEFEPVLLKSIQKQLDLGNDFNKAKKGSMIVARDIGRVCAMLTKGGTVTKALFEDVFTFVRHRHPACPIPHGGTGGGGEWCDSGG